MTINLTRSTATRPQSPPPAPPPSASGDADASGGLVESLITTSVKSGASGDGRQAAAPEPLLTDPPRTPLDGPRSAETGPAGTEAMSIAQGSSPNLPDKKLRDSAYLDLKYLLFTGEDFRQAFPDVLQDEAPGMERPTHLGTMVERAKEDREYAAALGYVLRVLKDTDKIDLDRLTDTIEALGPEAGEAAVVILDAADSGSFTLSFVDKTLETADGVGFRGEARWNSGMLMAAIEKGQELDIPGFEKRVALRLYEYPEARQALFSDITATDAELFAQSPLGRALQIATYSPFRDFALWAINEGLSQVDRELPSVRPLGSDKPAYPGRTEKILELVNNVALEGTLPADITADLTQELLAANVNLRGIADQSLLIHASNSFQINFPRMVPEALNRARASQLEFENPTGIENIEELLKEGNRDDPEFLPVMISQVYLNPSLPESARRTMTSTIQVQRDGYLNSINSGNEVIRTGKTPGGAVATEEELEAAKTGVLLDARRLGALTGLIDAGFARAEKDRKEVFERSGAGVYLNVALNRVLGLVNADLKEVAKAVGIDEKELRKYVAGEVNVGKQQAEKIIEFVKDSISLDAIAALPKVEEAGMSPETDEWHYSIRSAYMEGYKWVEDAQPKRGAVAPDSLPGADEEAVLVASRPGGTGPVTTALRDGPDAADGGSALTGAAARFREAEQTVLAREGTTPTQAASAAVDASRIFALDGEGPGLTNEPYKAGRLAGLEGPERPAAELIFDAVYDPLARAVDAAQIEGDLGAVAELRRAGIEIGPGGFVVEGERGSAVAQIERIAGDAATNPERIEPVVRALAALPPDADPGVVKATVAAALAGDMPEPAPGATDAGALRAAAKEQIGLLTQLGGNEAAVAFLRAFDLVMGAVEAAGGEFDGAALGDFLSSGAGSLGFLLEKVGAGDAEAWSALSSDLGAFAKSLDDGKREAFVEGAHALNVAGAALILAGSGETPDDALIVSGELVSIVGEGMLAAAGKPVPGFPGGIEVPPERAIGAGFGRLLNRYADGTGTKVDDVAAVLVEKGLPTWTALEAPDVVKDGRVVMDSDLAAASSAVSLAGGVLSEVIDGRAGEIVGALADGTATGLSLAAGTVNPAQAIVGLTRSVFDVAGVEIPPEVQTGALVAMAAAQASNPVGWVALGLQLAFGLGGTKSWTEVTDVAPNIDADADFSFDDTGQISTDLHRNFWGRVKVDDGRIQYDVNGVNPELLERATFDLEAEVEASLEHAQYRDWNPTLVLNGEEIRGRIETGRGDAVTFRGKVQGRRGLVKDAFFVSADEALKLPVKVGNHGSDDDNDGYGASFKLAEGATEGLPMQHRLKVEGTYLGLNPVTGGETFSHDVTLSPEQHAALEAELGGTEPIALEGSDPRLRGTDGETELMRVMDAQSWTFDSERKDPNLYQYMDMNGDGALDLVRYGIKKDRDGLHSGDKRYEVTLLGPEREPLGLPTIKTDGLQRAGEIATLAPYVLAWAAARPEVGRAGHDLTSLHFAAAQAGALDGIKELSNLERRLGADMAAAAALLSSGEGVDDAAWDSFAASLGTDEGDMARRAELREALGLFDAGAYGAANPDLIEALGGDPARLAAHYVAHGNREGRAIDEAGTVEPVAAPPTMPGVIHLGDTLEPGMEMRRGEMLMSASGRFAAVFELDGDFEIVDLESPEAAPLWRADDDGDWIAMQTDGNLVLYEDDDDAQFATKTHNEEAERPFSATIGDDGVLRVIDSQADAVLWTSAEGRLAQAAPNAAPA